MEQSSTVKIKYIILLSTDDVGNIFYKLRSQAITHLCPSTALGTAFSQKTARRGISAALSAFRFVLFQTLNLQNDILFSCSVPAAIKF
jgi:hypothetical protein